MFDIKKLNKSSFRGVPFYTKDDELSGGQRLTDHSFINGGTLTESNGIKNNIIKISGYIGGDDYLNQREALKQVLEDITSGILIDKFHGKLEVYVDTWSIKESISKIGMADVDITFKKATNKLLKTKEIVYTVDARPAAIEYFKKTYDPIAAGKHFERNILDDIIDLWEKVEAGIKFLEDLRDFSQNIKSKVGGMIAKVKGAIISIKSLVSDIIGIWSSFDEIFDFKLHDSTSLKNYTSAIRSMAVTTSLKSSNNYAEKKALEASKAYIYCAVVGMIHSSIKSLEYVQFTTGDDFGSIKDDILITMDILEKDITQSNDINKIMASQDLLNKYQESRKEFITFYTAKFSKLQNLTADTIIKTDDILHYTMNKYEDIARVNEVLDNNSIVNPLFMSGDIQVLAR